MSMRTGNAAGACGPVPGAVRERFLRIIRSAVITLTRGLLGIAVTMPPLTANTPAIPLPAGVFPV